MKSELELEFKLKLLKLYPHYDKVTGPYLRKDGRKHIVLNNSSLSKGDKSKLRTISWPKALMEVKLNRLLSNYETVDHIDENLSNDDYDNLQLLSREANIIKSFNLNPYRFSEYLSYVCSECNNQFLVLARQVRGNQIRQNKAGPFCSRVCAGKYSRKIQLAV